MERHTVTIQFVNRSLNLVLLPTLADRNEAFRKALRQFEPRPQVELLREGYDPLPLHRASDADAMFADGLRITGKLKRKTLVIVP